MFHRLHGAALAVAIGSAACALRGTDVPTELQPRDGERLALTVAASGVQVYECRPGTGGEARWVFVAPEARLHDATGRLVGDHGAGPSWTALDGSRLTGRVLARADAPSKADIPWLLLEAVSDGSRGAFAGVTRIQRVHTQGGLAPEGPCVAGHTERVPYRADYRLFRPAGATS